jgi:hypothetical protein
MKSPHLALLQPLHSTAFSSAVEIIFQRTSLMYFDLKNNSLATTQKASKTLAQKAICKKLGIDEMPRPP